MEKARTAETDPARATKAGTTMALGRTAARMAKAGMARAAAVRRANIMYGRCKGGSEGGEEQKEINRMKAKGGEKDRISLLF